MLSQEKRLRNAAESPIFEYFNIQTFYYLIFFSENVK